MDSTTTAPQIRDFSEFCDQLHDIRSKFHKWDSCERTVALYYLMAGLPFANARFLQHALEQCISAANTPEVQLLERNANNSAFISRLLTEHPQNALSLLLSHLPLLKPGNKEAAHSYLMTIRRVLSEFIAPPYKIYNECVEIMSYVFIHPAFDKEEKKSFKHLLKQVLNKVTPENFVHSPVNESSDESSSAVSPNPEKRLNRRSNSLTTPSLIQMGSHDSLSKDIWSSQENLAQQQQHPPCKPRSYSLSSDKSLMNLNLLQSSSSETRLQDLHILNNTPVMRSILIWLKSLRLHKYNWVFHNLTYKEMLDLCEETLQAIGITKGARHKLLLSLGKLKERSAMLSELETEVMNGGDLNAALKKLKGVLQTPLQVTYGEDLPSQFIKVMGKVCTQLLMLRQPSDENLMLFSTLCERADSCEAFSDEQKRRLNMWRGQLSKGNHVAAMFSTKTAANVANSTCNRTNWQSNKLALPTTNVFQVDKHSNTQKSSSYPNMQKSHHMTRLHRHSIGGSSSVSSSNHQFNHRKDPPPPTPQQPVGVKSLNLLSNDVKNNTSNNQFHVRFEDTPSSPLNNVFVVDTTTANHLTNNKKLKANHIISKNSDIENSLESLCLQMMEHALGP